VGFLGPNGAGKTTTMRMLTGFLPMSEGSAHVAGFDVFEDPIAVKARVGYLPESPPLYPELSVGEYLRFTAELRGVPASRRLARIGEAMERVGLQGTEARLLGSLSKGYRQRVGLAQALVHDPPLLILDEPTSGLDPAQLVGIRALIRELGRERMVVLSTHVLSEVEALCERVIILHRGRIAGDGTVSTLAETSGSGPWLDLIVDAGVDSPETALASLEAIGEIRRNPGNGVRDVFSLRGKAGISRESVAPAVAALAVARGWPIQHLAWRQSSLEDVFLSLVGAEA
jgi:ABC-2 type transport system ATP-binding protein